MTRRPAACLAAFAAFAAAAAGCQGRKPEAKPPPPAAVTVAHPLTHPVQTYLEYNGFLDAVETVQIKARVKGFLTEIHFREGDEVRAGEPLYTIDPREYLATVAKSKADLAKARADVQRAEADIKFQTAEVGRLEKAGKSGAAPETDVEKARATLGVNQAQQASAVASVAAAEAAVQTAELELGYTEIAAPIAGRISRTLVTKGNLVGQAEPTLLTTIVRMDPVFVYFDVPEADRGKLERRSGPVPVAVAVGVANETGYPHAGTLDFQENRADQGTGTLRLRGVLPNPARPLPDGTRDRPLYPGLYARVRVPVGGPEPRLLVPEAALMTGQEGRYLYVLKPDNTVEKLLVAVGTRLGTLVAIEKLPGAGKRTLTAADRVIVTGVQKARPDGQTPVAPTEVTLTVPAEK